VPSPPLAHEPFLEPLGRLAPWVPRLRGTHPGPTERRSVRPRVVARA
jgi:hypothetical protein